MGEGESGIILLIKYMHILFHKYGVHGAHRTSNAKRVIAVDAYLVIYNFV